MSLRSRIVALAGSVVAVGGLALAPAVFTATPASAAQWNVNIFACSFAFSSSGSSFTYTSDTVTVNGVTVSQGQTCL